MFLGDYQSLSVERGEGCSVLRHGDQGGLGGARGPVYTRVRRTFSGVATAIFASNE